MKREIKERIDRAARRKKSRSHVGSKALQRLFAYLGRRDPNLNNDVLARIAVPVAARPGFGLTKMATRAGPLSISRIRRVRPPSAAAKSFATAIISAASAIGRRPRRKAIARVARPAVSAVAVTGAAEVWQEIGPRRIPNGQTYGTNRPDVIGRVASIAVDPSDPKHLLVGSAGGGIWESTDTGATWTPRTDQLPSLAIGAVTFDPSAPSRVYAGSGEGNFYWNLGSGVYKSTDGGTTWSVAASAPFVGVGFFDLVVDPKSPSILYAATTNGFYKSANSGASWSLKRSSPCWDISVHPSGGGVEILAAFGDGLFVSTDAGNSFARVTLPASPSSPWLRLAVDRVATSPDVAYVFGAAGMAAYLWRRTGTTWKKVKLPAVNRGPDYDPKKLDIGQASYDWYVAVSPDNVGQVFIGAIDAFRGKLTGSTWKWTNVTTQGANSIHPDQHCLTFSPDNSKIIYAGSDGGIFRSADAGATWNALNDGLGITEIEYLASDPSTWQWLLAGLQDNGTIIYTGSPTWPHVGDGDGGDCGVNQSNPNIVYHSYYDVSLDRSTDKGASWTDLKPPHFSAFDHPPTSLFYPPVEVSDLTVAIGAQSLVVSRSGANPWSTVPLGLSSGDLPSAMRAADANTLLLGTTSGGMLKMVWNGTKWVKTQLASPTGRYISCVAVDPSNVQRIWVTVSQVGGGLVYRSDDGGTSWVNCTAGLPNIPMNAVVVDPANYKRVWVAADVGVYQSTSLGSSWIIFSTGLPNAMVVDLILHKQDRILICGTRNRGAWAIPVP